MLKYNFWHLKHIQFEWEGGKHAAHNSSDMDLSDKRETKQKVSIKANQPLIPFTKSDRPTKIPADVSKRKSR